MKKLIYLLPVLSLFFTGCNPMDNIYSEIDAQQQIITGESTFALSDADYTFLGSNYGNFNSVEDAKTKIPSLLSDKYPVWGNGSLAAVSFQVYTPKKNEKSIVKHTVTSADYSTLGFTYGNFSRFSNITTFLDWKYPNPTNRMLVSLTYKYYSGSVKTLHNGFLYLNGAWEFIQGFTSTDYSAMGERYADFSNSDEAAAKIPVFLLDKFKYDGKSAGDIQAMMYELYVTDVNDIDGDGFTDDKTDYSYVSYFVYDGASWAKYTNEITETVKFGHDGTTWVPDNTIKYTLVSADYAYMSSELEGNADFTNVSLANLANYGDYDYNWSDAQILYSLNLLLKHLNPSAVDGQKYVLTYVLYDNGLNILSINLILTNGEWVLNN